MSVIPGAQWSGSSSRAGSRPARGLTLIELLATISIMVILMMIAVPAFNDATLNGKLTSYANELVSSAYLARSEAMKRNGAVTLCVTADGSSCMSDADATSRRWERGWIVRASDGTVIHRQEALKAGFVVGSSVSRLDFQPSGVGASAAATLTICRNAPTSGALEKVVAISATGQAMVDTTHNGSCP